MSADPEVLRGLADYAECRELTDLIAETVALARQHGTEKVVISGSPANWDLIIAALRAPQNDGAAAMRESIARWHDKVANDRALRLCARDGHREIYDLLFAERVIHRDCARAVRSMPLPPALASQEPGTGGER